MGRFVLNFADGSNQVVPLIAGYNIRDWAPNNPSDIVNTVTDPRVSQAFFGHLDYGGYVARIDMLSLVLPQTRHLVSIELFDTSRSCSVTPDVGINIYAMTVVSQVPEPSSILALLCGIFTSTAYILSGG